MKRPRTVDMSSLLVRNVGDMWIRDEMERAYGALDYKDKMVLDIGANIGAFAMLASKLGAKTIHCFEPDPANYAMLVKNVEDLTATVFSSSVAIARSDENRMFKQATGHNRGLGHLSQDGKLVVKCMSFRSVVEFEAWDIVKIDIEGGEHSFLPGFVWPACVRQLAIEFHSRNQDEFDNCMSEIEEIVGQGFKIVQEDMSDYAQLRSGRRKAVPLQFTR